MKFEKILSDSLESCYSVARLQHEAEDFLLVASEVEQSCFAYNLNKDLERTTVWDQVGGTMSIIQIPGSLDFLATQKFYPGFDAKECQIVQGTYKGDGSWEISKVTDFPYLHRFDLIQEKSGRILFVGCTIANSKTFVEDWSDKGKIVVGEFNHQESNLFNLRELALRLLKNHGYYDVKEEGYSLITGVEGILKLTYPEYSDSGDWRLDLIFNEETSDIVQVDLDGDGQKENIIIQGFHGDRLRVFNQDFSQEIFHHPEATPFGHAIWSGSLLGDDVFVFGWRSGKADLMLYRYQGQSIEPIMVEADSASSNCLAFEKDGRAYIFSANNGRHHVALYELTK
ncbi:hypothetical protein [Streptococcus saliviloxodontae]|uniref:WD40 repeat domain-containing protein n=1 Tax=Streptococcus saliviloxodontae TaxID=1349416 RepID=A0ABS2PJE1_9STRE|nr:hypothetical protein [Streptococcus saliviloxodontae]MBM7635474.1 hypothetical protein [Streptococcus saliviloxodontae]